MQRYRGEESVVQRRHILQVYQCLQDTTLINQASIGIIATIELIGIFSIQFFFFNILQFDQLLFLFAYTKLM